MGLFQPAYGVVDWYFLEVRDLQKHAAGELR